MFNTTGFKTFRKAICSILVLAFLLHSSFGFGQLTGAGLLTPPRQMLNLSSAYTPVILKGMVINPRDPLQFDFIMDTGTGRAAGERLRREADKSIKYFLASLTVPEDELWVNLSPVEKDRIIPPGLNKTIMGRDLLAEDYVLKQLTSSLHHPENAVGKQLWQKIYALAEKELGSRDAAVKTLNRVWIIPEKAQIWENAGKAIILNSRLKVMMEKDYLNPTGTKPGKGTFDEKITQIYRDILIPAIEKEVNAGQNFATLRQIYAAMILASWYKIRLKESLLAKAYADQNKVAGIEFFDGIDKDAVYAKYLQSARDGVFHLIRDESAQNSEEINTRKYVSGGFSASSPVSLRTVITTSLIVGTLFGLTPAASAQAQARPAGEYVQVKSGVQDIGQADKKFLMSREVDDQHTPRQYVPVEGRDIVKKVVSTRKQQKGSSPLWLAVLHKAQNTPESVTDADFAELLWNIVDDQLAARDSDPYDLRSEAERGGPPQTYYVRESIVNTEVIAVLDLLASRNPTVFNAHNFQILIEILLSPVWITYRDDEGNVMDRESSLREAGWQVMRFFQKVNPQLFVKEGSDAARAVHHALESPDHLFVRPNAQALQSFFGSLSPEGGGSSAKVPEVSSPIDQKLGGVNLDPRKLDMQFKRGPDGVAAPVSDQPWTAMHIQGFIPVIYQITPVNLPKFLGFNTPTQSSPH
ncbi:MAG: hypothetical protein HQL23_09720 [Candidatus Omnitrophica bacterium]|nr:hypothetical protein [Candidatus Omnitrophota bacterium]